MKSRNKDRISVIIPTYNRSKYICEAIDSVLIQTYPVFEIIVVDDGSTDNTKKILQKRYGDKIRYFYQKNKGPAAARNLGIKRTKGNFIAFLDSDDLWKKNKIKLQFDFLNKNPNLDFVFGDMEVYSGFKKIDKSFIGKSKFKKYLIKNQNNLLNLFDYLLFANFIPTPTVLFKKKCIKKVGLFNENFKSVEDREYWLRFAFKCNIGYLNNILIRRRLHDTNIVLDAFLGLNSLLLVLEDVQRRFNSELSNKRKNLFKKARKKVYYLFGSYYFKNKDYNNAYLYFLRIFPDYIFNFKYVIKFIISIIYQVLNLRDLENEKK